MRFHTSFGGFGDDPGQLKYPKGIAIVRGLLVVTEPAAKRLQVLSPHGVPFQVLPFAFHPDGVCADEEHVWVADAYSKEVHEVGLCYA